MYELTIKSEFASAHFIPGYAGECRDLHGHTWKVEVTVESEKLDSLGMVVDFKVMKERLKEFLKAIDHVCLNDLSYFKTANPTTEHLAKYIFDEFAKACQPLKIKRVRVWESDTSDVTYFSSDS